MSERVPVATYAHVTRGAERGPVNALLRGLLPGLVVGCIACSSASYGAPDSPGDGPRITGSAGGGGLPDRTQASSRDAWLRGAFLRSGSGRADAIAEYASPDDVLREPVANEHVEGQVDTLVTFVYDRGLRVGFYVTATGREMLMGATVEAPGLLRLGPVDVGSLWSDVTDAFGPPSGTLEGMPYYDCESCIGPDEPVFFDVVADTVRSITFTYYVG